MSYRLFNRCWWMWRTIYLSKLPRLEKKIRVALDWTLDVLFSKDLCQFLDVQQEHKIRSGNVQRGQALGQPQIETKEQPLAVAARA